MTYFLMLLLWAAFCVCAAMVGRRELLSLPRSALRSKTFLSLSIYFLLVLIPAGVYLYLFHGDWFVSYLFDTTRVPSAVALLLIVFAYLIGAGLFVFSAYLNRRRRSILIPALVAVLLTCGISVHFLFRPRFALVGTYEQFDKKFGLTHLYDADVTNPSLILGAVSVVFFLFLLGRIHWGQKTFVD